MAHQTQQPRSFSNTFNQKMPGTDGRSFCGAKHVFCHWAVTQFLSKHLLLFFISRLRRDRNTLRQFAKKMTKQKSILHHHLPQKCNDSIFWTEIYLGDWEPTFGRSKMPPLQVRHIHYSGIVLIFPSNFPQIRDHTFEIRNIGKHQHK